MKHPTSAALYEHWRSLRRGAGAVAWADIQPRDLGPLIPDLFLIDTDAGKGARFRFCGELLARRYGRDLNGESFLALWAGEDQGLLRRHLSAPGRNYCGIILGVLAETAGGGFTSFEMPLLPLRTENRWDGAIGCMVRVAGHEDSNRIRARVVSQEIRSLRFLGGEGQPAVAALRHRGSGTPLPSPARPAPPTADRAGHLTLVTGGK